MKRMQKLQKEIMNELILFSNTNNNNEKEYSFKGVVLSLSMSNNCKRDLYTATIQLFVDGFLEIPITASAYVEDRLIDLIKAQLEFVKNSFKNMPKVGQLKQDDE